MTIDMSTVTTITLNNQDVTKIEDSLGNVLWQKGSGPTPPTPTTVIDKFPDATIKILQRSGGGPISNYTNVVNPEFGHGSPAENDIELYTITVDDEIYTRRIKLYGSRADPSSQSLLQFNVASNSTIYLICRSTNTSTARDIYINGTLTSYVTPVSDDSVKLALPMTAGVHTIGFGGNTYIWGIIGDLVEQNNQ